jgi:putative hemolysin
MPTSRFRCAIARTAREIRDAQHVRWRVYGEEEKLLPASACLDGREIDARDDREETLHLIVYVAGEAVGTVRLLQAEAGTMARKGGRLGLALESKVDLAGLAAPEIVPAEITRYCVLRQYRCTRVTQALLSGLRDESERRGITHWVAGANMETDCAEDAALAYRVAHDKNLISSRFRAEARAPHLARTPGTPRARHCYTREQRLRALAGDRAGLELPRILALFARWMGARFIGAPLYDAQFKVFALPLVAALADITARRTDDRGAARAAPREAGAADQDDQQE